MEVSCGAARVSTTRKKDTSIVHVFQFDYDSACYSMRRNDSKLSFSVVPAVNGDLNLVTVDRHVLVVLDSLSLMFIAQEERILTSLCRNAWCRLDIITFKTLKHQ